MAEKGTGADHDDRCLSPFPRCSSVRLPVSCALRQRSGHNSSIRSRTSAASNPAAPHKTASAASGIGSSSGNTANSRYRCRTSRPKGWSGVRRLSRPRWSRSHAADRDAGSRQTASAAWPNRAAAAGPGHRARRSAALDHGADHRQGQRQIAALPRDFGRLGRQRLRFWPAHSANSFSDSSRLSRSTRCIAAPSLAARSGCEW